MSKTQKTKKKKKSSKAAPTPEQQKQSKQKRTARRVFHRLGFARIRADGKEFQFEGRTGELDDIFVYENVLILVEYTVGKSTTSHVLKKKVLFDLISVNTSDWITFASGIYPPLESHVSEAGYANSEYQVRIVYIAT